MMTERMHMNPKIKTWAPVDEIEPQAVEQLERTARLPWVAHMAVMPDVHFGIGATVGSVIAMRGALAPAAVGVDIGCGMTAVRTTLAAGDLPDSLKALRSQIERDVPVGFNAHKDDPLEHFGGAGPELCRIRRDRLMTQFDDLDVRGRLEPGRAILQCGTLGGGNHFIEVCLDSEQRVWIMLHSGSRGVGNRIASVHMERAQGLGHNQALEDRDLAVFLAGTPEMDAYRRDLMWAQEYARLNRDVMLALVKRSLQQIMGSLTVNYDTWVSCHHNYVEEEEHFGEELLVTRKGAIRARAGDMGIIPGSMGARSFIVRGLGSAESLNSASHGAGRKMSRGAAKRAFTVEDVAAQTAGVECRKDADVIDEIPAAYKDIDRVMAQQSDLVEVVAELKQILCVKG